MTIYNNFRYTLVKVGVRRGSIDRPSNSEKPIEDFLVHRCFMSYCDEITHIINDDGVIEVPLSADLFKYRYPLHLLYPCLTSVLTGGEKVG